MFCFFCRQPLVIVVSNRLLEILLLKNVNLVSKTMFSLNISSLCDNLITKFLIFLNYGVRGSFVHSFFM